MTRRLWGLGAGLVLFLAYVVAALGTQQLSGQPLRPLFDGFVTPQPYKWVKPPAGLEKDNKAPSEKVVDVPLDANGSPPINAATDDGQAIAGLATGSVPTRFPDTKVHLTVKPVDPATLGSLPAGLRPESNTYDVTMAYQPSGMVVTALAKPGTIALTAAAPVDALLFSPDGRQWQTIEARPFGDPAVYGRFAPLAATGYYLSASRNPPRRGGASSRAPVVLGVLVALIAGAALAIGLVARRSSRRGAAANRRRRRGPRLPPGS